VPFQKDPKNPRFWLFETTIPADSIKDKTTLTLVPIKGTRFERSFNADSPLIRQRRLNAATVVVKVDSSEVKPVVSDSQRLPLPVQRRDPWPGFKKRSIAYGVGAGAGVLFVVLSKSDNNCAATSSTYNCPNDGGGSGARTFGVGLVAASVGLLGIDAFLTSRRDRDAKQNVALKTSSSNAFQFAAPAIVDLHRGFGIGVVRLSLR
jgi:hypothetical protein